VAEVVKDKRVAEVVKSKNFLSLLWRTQATEKHRRYLTAKGGVSVRRN
jgi:hypothetical protein